MPTKLMTIKSKRKDNFGEPVEVSAYYWTPKSKLLGVLFGHFAPFTGKYGHARLIYEAQKYGIEDFVVVMPANLSPLDDNRNLFTDEQKIKIVKEGCKELGINLLDCWVENFRNPNAVMGMVQRKYQDYRIVVCCGPDRAKLYTKLAVPYAKDNTPFLDPEDPNFRKQEMIVCEDRGARETSGTRIREILKNGTVKEFMEETGYSSKMWVMMRNFIKKNGVVELKESFFEKYNKEKYLNEGIVDTPKVHIKHLYNPGNSMQLKANEFLDIIDWLKQQNGKLDDNINVSYSEKCDGLPCRFGLDGAGRFFLEQGKSGPIFDAEEFTNRDIERVGYKTRINTAWKKVFIKLKNNKKFQNILKKYNTETGLKVIGEVFINSVAFKGRKDDLIRYIGTEYYKSKMGTFCSFILINAIDGENNDLEEFEDIKNDLIKISSPEVMFDDTNYRNKFGAIDFNEEIKELDNVIKGLEKEFGSDVKSILANPSRKKDDLSKKKKIKELIEEYQGKFDRKIQNLFNQTDGKWGPEREGIVLKLANNIMLKITSDTFKKFQANNKKENDEYGFQKHREWIFGPADEDDEKNESLSSLVNTLSKTVGEFINESKKSNK